MKGKIRRNAPIDLSKYINSETGETLESEGAVVVRNEDTGLVTISSGEYATIDAAAWDYICGILNDADVGKVSKMAQMTKTSLNLLYAGNNRPHSSKTLQVALSIKSQRMFFELVKRLKKAGVIYVLDGLILGEVRKVYMLNPFLARKRKTIVDWAANKFKELGNENK